MDEGGPPPLWVPADELKEETEPKYVDIAVGTVLGFLAEPNYKSRLVSKRSPIR